MWSRRATSSRPSAEARGLAGIRRPGLPACLVPALAQWLAAVVAVPRAVVHRHEPNPAGLPAAEHATCHGFSSREPGRNGRDHGQNPWQVGPAVRMAGSRVVGMGVAAGQRASVSAVVADADTAISAGSGDVPVLATPRLLALAEAATVAAIAPHLPPGMTSVGTSASLEHRRASPVGAEVVVEAELTE